MKLKDILQERNFEFASSLNTSQGEFKIYTNEKGEEIVLGHKGNFWYRKSDGTVHTNRS